MTTNEKPDSQHIIELSTVYFYEGTAPRVISLKDCGLPMESPVPGAFSALYGYQSKQEGFMAARAYADKHRLNFTVIDFLVKLDQKQNPLMMKPEDLAQHDFISFQRLSRSMMNELHEILEKRLVEEGADQAKIASLKPNLLTLERPDLIASVINEPGWRHLKLIAYPTKAAISDRPLNVGTVPFRHWDAIQNATCRLNPNIHITLEPPSDATKHADNSRHTASPKVKDRHSGSKMR